jgi:hypothetical protein
MFQAFYKDIKINKDIKIEKEFFENNVNIWFDSQLRFEFRQEFTLYWLKNRSLFPLGFDNISTKLEYSQL